MQPQVCVCGSLFQRLLNSYHFLCFHSLTSCCFQIVVKPLSLLPTYFGGNESNSAWLLSCVQTGGDLPRAQMIPISWFWLPIFGTKLWNVRYQLSIPLLRFHFSLVLYTFHLVTSAAVHWTLNCGNRIGVYFLSLFLSWSIPQGIFWNNPERISTFFFLRVLKVTFLVAETPVCIFLIPFCQWSLASKQARSIEVPCFWVIGK